MTIQTSLSRSSLVAAAARKKPNHVLAGRSVQHTQGSPVGFWFGHTTSPELLFKLLLHGASRRPPSHGSILWIRAVMLKSFYMHLDKGSREHLSPFHIMF